MPAWVHLAVLWAFAFAKPLFDVLADAPDFFVARGNTRGDILLFAIAMVIVPPTALIGVEALVLRLPGVRRALHLLFVAGLAGAFVLQLLDDALGGSTAALVAGGALGGVAVAFAYARTRAVPAVLTVLGPVPLVFLVIFLVASPVSKLILPQDSAEAAAADVRSDTPVVVIVFDEFDPNMLMEARQRIDRTRYPNFAAFAGDATWYRNATTVNSQTTLAVPGLLSGRRPTPDDLPIATDYPNSLFSLLGKSHSFHVTETATEVCPESLCGSRARAPVGSRLRSLAKDLGIVSLHLLAPEGVQSSLPAVDQTFGDFGGGGRDQADGQSQPDVPASALRNRPGQFDALLRGIGADSDRPGLHFLHSALPHIPWQYLPSGEQYINNGPDYPGLDRETWSTAPFPARLGLQRHLLQVGYVDRLVGRLVERLRSAGIYDEALVVLTADHGVAYRPGQPRRAPTPGNFSDIAAVPLLIKYPGESEGRIDDSPARTIDIVPTIAHELGAKLPWKAAGRPLGAGSGSQGGVTVGVGATGRNLSVPFDEYVRRREAGLRRILDLFGSGDGGSGLYANGPGTDLLARPVARFARAAPAGGRVELDSADLLDSFRPGARLVPSFVSGRITGAVAAGVPLAVAVNGRVAGTTESFQDGDDVRLAAVVPASAFRSGANSLEIFAIEGEGSGRRLAALETERPEAYRLVEEDGETTIEGGGRTFRVEDDRLEGYVDKFELDDQGVRMSGWAVDPEGRRPAERVLVFAGERLVAQARPTVVRPDIVERFNSAKVERSGFELRGGAQGAGLDDLRVFAVAGDSASELPRYEP